MKKMHSLRTSFLILAEIMSLDMEIDDISNSKLPGHVLPQPLHVYPNDIMQIASSLRALILPELKLVVRRAIEEVT